jgi:hypothetical protein
MRRGLRHAPGPARGATRSRATGFTKRKVTGSERIFLTVSLAISSHCDCVSGPVGREKVHFEAPPAHTLPAQTAAFLEWFNANPSGDTLVHTGLAHLWLVTLHLFDDVNGRISRAAGDMALARTEGSVDRFDRAEDQAGIRRLHVNDGCQALGLAVAMKYERAYGEGRAGRTDLQAPTQDGAQDRDLQSL